MKKPNRISLLIEDNRVTNFFNKQVLESSGVFHDVVALENCLEATNFLNPEKNSNRMPDVIFLDLYTPLMNGWEFLEKYEKLGKDLWGSVVILHNEELLAEEKKKLDQYPFVKAKSSKNLNKESLYMLLKKIELKEGSLNQIQ